MIPKIIHLCWFSGDPYPPMIKSCIESWHREMPEYKIMHWTEEMARALNNSYVNEALDHKKYAFAADVVRIYALYKNGGIYLDSDIYLKKSLESLLTDDFVSTIEYHQSLIQESQIDTNFNRSDSCEVVNGIGIQAAFLASTPNNPLLKEILDFYNNQPFLIKDGKVLTSLLAPSVYAKQLEKYGFKYKDEFQKFSNVTLYPSYNISSEITYDHSKALGIHCCKQSWVKLTKYGKLKQNIKKFLFKIRLLKDPFLQVISTN